MQYKVRKFLTTHGCKYKCEKQSVLIVQWIEQRSPKA